MNGFRRQPSQWSDAIKGIDVVLFYSMFSHLNYLTIDGFFHCKCNDLFDMRNVLPLLTKLDVFKCSFGGDALVFLQELIELRRTDLTHLRLGMDNGFQLPVTMPCLKDLVACDLIATNFRALQMCPNLIRLTVLQKGIDDAFYYKFLMKVPTRYLSLKAIQINNWEPLFLHNFSFALLHNNFSELVIIGMSVKAPAREFHCRHWKTTKDPIYQCANGDCSFSYFRFDWHHHKPCVPQDCGFWSTKYTYW